MFNFKLVVLIIYYLDISTCNGEHLTRNLTGSKDMYVVRATVYQVGILTNRTNDTAEPGRQEAITIYHNNGSSFDLSAIHNPLLTNITAEKVVGVVPVTNETLPWNTIKQLVVPQGELKELKKIPKTPKHISMESDIEAKKSKRDVSKTPVEIVRGSAVIPSEAGIHSIALPPLIALNKNLSKIPVPIPNMSVVSYAKVDTLIHSP